MSKSDFNFQRDLKEAILNSEMDRKELLKMTFKYWVAKLFEHIQVKHGADRLESDYVVEVKKNLITEFRNTDLGEYQMSEEQYDDLFEQTVQEILQEAALHHQGEDLASIESTLSINKEKYIQEGGLFVPEHLKKNN